MKSMPLLAVLVVLFSLTARAAINPDQSSIDQLDALLADSTSPEDLITVGDMRFRAAVLTAFRDQLASLGTRRPQAAASASASLNLWTGGIVYYSIDASVTTTHRQAFLDASTDWTTFANLTFVVRTNQPDYIRVKEVPGLDGGNSAVGRIGGPQDLNIGPGSFNRNTLCHEIGHALGLVHEHQRSDRDDFVTINSGNYPSGAEPNFIKLPSSNNLGAYDFLSVMHYARDTLANPNPPGLDTITPKPAYLGFIDLMGRQSDRVLSKLDRTGMATLYGAGPSLAPVVTSTADAGPGSLRAAIYQAADTPGTTITFNIPTSDPGYNAGTGVFTIAPTGFMTRPGANTTIDATTQSLNRGNTNANGPEILLSGTILRADTFLSASGFNLAEANCTVRGFIIQDFEEYGVSIRGAGSTGNRVVGCYIGTNTDGTGAVKNFLGGIDVSGAAHANFIGGVNPADRNLISGNGGYGIRIRDSGTVANSVLGSYIGTNATGSGAIPNTFAGIGVTSGAQSNVIGGLSAGSRNVLSGNTGQGLILVNAGTSLNTVLGNYIGLNAAGTAPLPNSPVDHFGGIDVFDKATANTVGPGNFISGNAGGAALTVSQPGTDGNLIRGNVFGLNATQTAALPSDIGVAIFSGAQNNIVESGNLVSGLLANGISISGNGTTGNIVRGNLIGSTAFPNGGYGVAIFSNAASNTIGGSGIGHANSITGNSSGGVGVFDYNTPDPSQTIQNTITGNSISGNGFSGIFLYQNGNNSQAAPTLSSAVLTTVTTVSGTLTGPNNVTYRVEFFSSPTAGSAQGAVYLGARNVTTNGGSTAFTAPLAATVAAGYAITATVTAPGGDTSAFSSGRTVTSTDGDHDGLPQAYENATPGMSDSVAGDAASDLDGDGFSALSEFIAGTNPNDPASRPVSTGTLAGTDFTVSFGTIAGKSYRVERSASPGGPWSPVAVSILGTGGVIPIADFGASFATRMFYRVLVER